MQVMGEAPVRRAESSDHPRVARALAAAFADDPAWSWLMPFPDRQQRQQLFFETVLKYLVPERREVWTTEDGSAAAIGAPPGLWSVPPFPVLREAPPMLRVFG